MDFALSQEQQFLQSSISDFLAAECPLDYVRDCVANERTDDEKLRNGLSQLGIFGVVVPEEFGGVGLGYLEAALIAESLGSAVAPVVFVSTSVMAATALSLAGSQEQKDKWLPSIADGSKTIAVGLTEHIGNREGDAVSLGDSNLTGTATFVMEAKDADAYLLASQDGTLHIVDRDNVEIIKLKSIDQTRSIVQLKLTDADCETLEGSIGKHTILQSVIDVGRVMLSAETLGASQTMLQKAVDYAQERVQFNRVIGSFQAVKHMCAEMAAELEPCRSLVWYAAHSMLAIPEESHLMACHAKAHLAEVGQFVSRKSTEVHGGMGFTDLLGLHYWFKRIGLNRQLLGAPELVREEAAKAQGWV